MFSWPSQLFLLLFRISQSCLGQPFRLGPAQQQWSRGKERPEIQILLQLLSWTPMEQVHLEGTLSSNSHKGVSGQGCLVKAFYVT